MILSSFLDAADLDDRELLWRPDEPSTWSHICIGVVLCRRLQSPEDHWMVVGRCMARGLSVAQRVENVIEIYHLNIDAAATGLVLWADLGCVGQEATSSGSLDVASSRRQNATVGLQLDIVHALIPRKVDQFVLRVTAQRSILTNALGTTEAILLGEEIAVPLAIRFETIAIGPAWKPDESRLQLGLL